jgi:NAD(P)-dependent dehydrogenase (short-subunit alcohol dehydrogenase family)
VTAGGAAAPGRFEGRVAIVTGASRGIGFAVAERLIREGARVVVTARKPEALQQAADALGGRAVAIAVAGNASDPAHQQQAIDATLSAFGRLDVLVNNTGINPLAGPVTQAPPEAVAKTFAVNVAAPLSWTGRAVAAGLGAHPGGAIVNVASLTGQRPSPPIGIYGASKAALIHLTAELALELAPRVRVNAVAPAVVRTKFAEMLYAGREEQVVKGYPLGRLGDPEDVAAAVAFLASDDASWITGQTVTIDGGLTLQGAFA